MIWFPNIVDSNRNPMHRFSENDDDLTQLCLFLAEGQNPNQEVLGSCTLLHVAVQSQRKNDRVIQKLIDAGANIELTTNMEHTPLQLAVISRNRGAVQKLIKAGAQINVQNVFGRTALHYAIHSFQPRSKLQRFPWMHLLRSYPDLCIIKILLDNADTDVNTKDSQGETALMWAVKYRSLSAVKLLLKMGANPNILNHQAQNALHVALSVRKPSQGIITELLLNGTGIYDVDNQGKTPLDILQNGINYDSLNFVLKCLKIIAIKYKIRRDLVRKFERFPKFSHFLRKACQDVMWMKKQIICDKLNLHDFAYGCFQDRETEKQTLQIYLQVSETLNKVSSSRTFELYFYDIHYRIPLTAQYKLLKPGHPTHEMNCLMADYLYRVSSIKKCLS